jgi:hypothetical protein
MDESMRPEEAKTRFQGDPGDEQPVNVLHAIDWDWKVDPLSLGPDWYFDGNKPFTNRNA